MGWVGRLAVAALLRPAALPVPHLPGPTPAGPDPAVQCGWLHGQACAAQAAPIQVGGGPRTLPCSVGTPRHTRPPYSSFWCANHAIPLPSFQPRVGGGGGGRRWRAPPLLHRLHHHRLRKVGSLNLAGDSFAGVAAGLAAVCAWGGEAAHGLPPAATNAAHAGMQVPQVRALRHGVRPGAGGCRAVARSTASMRLPGSNEADLGLGLHIPRGPPRASHACQPAPPHRALAGDGCAGHEGEVPRAPPCGAHRGDGPQQVHLMRPGGAILGVPPLVPPFSTICTSPPACHKARCPR